MAFAVDLLVVFWVVAVILFEHVTHTRCDCEIDKSVVFTGGDCEAEDGPRPQVHPGAQVPCQDQPA